MTKPKFTDEETPRLKSYPGYWYDIIMGAVLTIGLMICTGFLLLSAFGLTYLFTPFIVFCIIVVFFYQWKDDNLTRIYTGLSAKENDNLIKAALDRLNWDYHKRSKDIDLTLNKYFLKFLDPTIISGDENIYINFKYHSTTQTGRLPFYFGISSFLRWKFTQELKSQISKYGLTPGYK